MTVGVGGRVAKSTGKGSQAQGNRLGEGPTLRRTAQAPSSQATEIYELLALYRSEELAGRDGTVVASPGSRSRRTRSRA